MDGMGKQSSREGNGGESGPYETGSSAETMEAGRRLAELLDAGRFLILRGGLGAGKTTLVKGIADALGAAEPDEVTSPTFTLIHEYEGVRERQGRREPVRLYHLDLYRLENERQLAALGLEELAGEGSIVLVEWGEKFPSVVARSDGEIAIEPTGGDGRRITLRWKE
jgi:tRNA threonylcarbamoyladenosine biosynthesis protein TsaE